MFSYEDMLNMYDEGNFLAYAVCALKVPENKAIVDYRNAHNVGKYVICESKNEGKRMYIRTVTDVMRDYHTKNGWWDTFTLSEIEVPAGL